MAGALPTLVVAAVIHGGWLALTWWHALLPLPLVAMLGGMIVAWHGSLQHETIHGHPTGWAPFDRLLGRVPLSLWLPYGIYLRTHLAHHATPHITDPRHDTESHYALGVGAAALAARLERTLAGRLLFGPPIRIGRFLVQEAVRAVHTLIAWARDWLPHMAAVAMILWWLHLVGVLLAFVYPASALTLLRSFAEHRAHPSRDRRAAIVEARGLLPLLFLNNNLHAVHHRHPALPWHRLPAAYRRDRTRYADAPLYRGYGEIVRRHLWRAHAAARHPDLAAS